MVAPGVDISGRPWGREIVSERFRFTAFPVHSGSGSQAFPVHSGSGSQASPVHTGSGSQAVPVHGGSGSFSTLETSVFINIGFRDPGFQTKSVRSLALGRRIF